MKSPPPCRHRRPSPQPTGRSLVAIAHDLRAIDGYDENPAVTRRMVDALVRTVTGCESTRAAWRELTGTDERVGIKVTTAGGAYFATRRGVVAAAVAGLKDAGVREVIVWDKSSSALRECGFTPERLGCEVRGIDAPRGWDRAASFQAPVLGKLIRGDLLFRKRSACATSNLLSSKSHLATILSKDVPRFINIAALSDEPGCGVAGTLHSAVVGNLDNWRRFTTFGESGATAIADCYADPRLGGKCVLHILDALAVTYAGGPGANPQAAAIHKTLYASRDPVALDSLGLELLEKWRKGLRFGPIGTKAAWLRGTAIGNSEPTHMIPPPHDERPRRHRRPAPLRFALVLSHHPYPPRAIARADRPRLFARPRQRHHRRYRRRARRGAARGISPRFSAWSSAADARICLPSSATSCRLKRRAGAHRPPRGMPRTPRRDGRSRPRGDPRASWKRSSAGKRLICSVFRRVLGAPSSRCKRPLSSMNTRISWPGALVNFGRGFASSAFRNTPRTSRKRSRGSAAIMARVCSS